MVRIIQGDSDIVSGKPISRNNVIGAETVNQKWVFKQHKYYLAVASQLRECAPFPVNLFVNLLGKL